MEMKIKYKNVYALCFHSFETNQTFVDTVYADEELANIALEIKDREERNGFYFVAKYFENYDGWKRREL